MLNSFTIRPERLAKVTCTLRINPDLTVECKQSY
jgi:hypothetical protein